MILTSRYFDRCGLLTASRKLFDRTVHCRPMSNSCLLLSIREYRIQYLHVHHNLGNAQTCKRVSCSCHHSNIKYPITVWTHGHVQLVAVVLQCPSRPVFSQNAHNHPSQAQPTNHHSQRHPGHRRKINTLNPTIHSTSPSSDNTLSQPA